MPEHCVLVVEDTEELADIYADRLSDTYQTMTAYDGTQALEVLDEHGEDVDVVLLDRRMPGMSGDEVLDEIKDRELDCAVAMVTAVDPDFDVIEMGFDDYLTKPIEGELHDAVDRLLSRSSYDSQMRDHLALVSKKATLEAEKSREQLQSSEQYRQLREQIAEYRNQLQRAISGDAFVELLIKEAGEQLYFVIEHDDHSHEYRYVDRAIEQRLATVESDLDALLEQFRQEGQESANLNAALDLDGYQCSLHLFGSMMIVRFPKTTTQGIVCGFDPSTAPNLTDFVSLVSPYIQGTQEQSSTQRSPNHL
jgi:DNA-binding response OmpR family regulator